MSYMSSQNKNYANQLFCTQNQTKRFKELVADPLKWNEGNEIYRKMVKYIISCSILPKSKISTTDKLPKFIYFFSKIH